MSIRKNIHALLKSNESAHNIYEFIRFRVFNLPNRKYLIKKRWELTFNEKLNLDNPTTFNEKLQWEKVYADSQLARNCVDKFKVRNYITQKIGKKYLNELYYLFDDVSEIDIAKLPRECVIKLTHDSGTVFILSGNRTITGTDLKHLKKRMKLNFGFAEQEWVYDNLDPKILVEKLLKDEEGKSPEDYKVFCFNGKPKIIQVNMDRFGEHRINYYDPDWKRLDLEINHPGASYDVAKPEKLDKMLELSAILAEPFNHVRVDWYIHENDLVFGELTFFHNSGRGIFNSREWAEKMGSWFEVSKDLGY